MRPAGGVATHPPAEARTKQWGRRRLRSRDQVLWQLRIERAIFLTEWKWLAAAVLVEYTHMVIGVLVYYIEGKVYGPAGPPQPSYDFGIWLFHDMIGLPQSLSWLEDFFLFSLLALVITVLVAHLFLRHSLTSRAVVVEGLEPGSSFVMPVPVMLVLKRLMQAFCVTIPLRMLSFIFTLMPNPKPECFPPNWDPPQTIAEVFARWTVGRHNCGDLLFSGHTSHATIATLMIMTYFPQPRVLPWLSSCLLLGLIWSLLTFRGHYTADVVVALYTSFLVWKVLPSEPETLSCYGIRAVPARLSIRTTGYQSDGDEEEASSDEEAASGGTEEVESHKGGRGGLLLLSPPSSPLSAPRPSSGPTGWHRWRRPRRHHGQAEEGETRSSCSSSSPSSTITSARSMAVMRPAVEPSSSSRPPQPPPQQAGEQAAAESKQGGDDDMV